MPSHCRQPPRRKGCGLDNEQVAEITKRGEMCVRVRLRRYGAGIRVSVQVHPVVEEFFRSWSGAEMAPVVVSGRNWMPVQKDSPPLNVYAMPALKPIMLEDGMIMRLDQPGQPLLAFDNDRGQQILNMSFLRLVGASQDLGQEFIIRSVMTLPEIKRLKESISHAAARFYTLYLKPVDLVVTISTQEMPT